MNAAINPVNYFKKMPIEDFVFSHLLERRAAEDKEAIFFTFEDKEYTLGGFNSQVNQMARNLVEQGVSKGTVVAVVMATSPEYLCLWFALAKIGAIEVPINSAYMGDILLHQLNTSGASFCVIDKNFYNNVNDVITGSEVKTCFVKDSEPQRLTAEFKEFGQLQKIQDDSNLDIEITYRDSCGIIFTSGTTGPSKGVLLSYRYLTAYGVMYADINVFHDDDVLMNFLPFFHLSGKFITIATLVCGGRMRLQSKLSVSGFFDEVKTHGITHSMGVGGVCNMLLSRPPLPDDADNTLRTIYAVPDPDVMHHKIEQRFNCRLTTVFGSTEVGLPLFRSLDTGYRAESCGKQSPYYDVQIVDEYDNEVPFGETGEIVVRPKLPFLTASGYVGMAEKTVESWRNLWLHSGDSGRRDDDGWFYFEDRVTDSLRRRGENISSFEVEVLVSKHPAVSEVAAVAFPSELGEDEVRVFVILLAEHEASAEEIFKHCAETMPYFMVPRYIDIVTDFPRTPTAKIEKYKLRQAPQSDSTWDSVAAGWSVKRTGVTRI